MTAADLGYSIQSTGYSKSSTDTRKQQTRRNNRQGDEANLVDRLTNLSMGKNDDVVSNKAMLSSDRSSKCRSSTNTRPPTMGSRLQDSLRSIASPNRPSTGPIKGDPKITTVGVSTRSTAQSKQQTLQEASTLGVKGGRVDKGKEKSRKQDDPNEGPPNPEKGKAKLPVKGPPQGYWRLSLIVFFPPRHGMHFWSLFLDRGDHRCIFNHVASIDGQWQLVDRRNDPPPMRYLHREIFVANIPPEDVPLYTETILPVPISLNPHVLNRDRIWCLDALRALRDRGLINVDVAGIQQQAESFP